MFWKLSKRYIKLLMCYEVSNRGFYKKKNENVKRKSLVVSIIIYNTFQRILLLFVNTI